MRSPVEIMAEAKDIASKFKSMPKNSRKDVRQVARLVALYEERGLPPREFAKAIVAQHEVDQLHRVRNGDLESLTQGPDEGRRGGEPAVTLVGMVSHLRRLMQAALSIAVEAHRLVVAPLLSTISTGRTFTT